MFVLGCVAGAALWAFLPSPGRNQTLSDPAPVPTPTLAPTLTQIPTATPVLVPTSVLTLTPPPSELFPFPGSPYIVGLPCPEPKAGEEVTEMHDYWRTLTYQKAIDSFPDRERLFFKDSVRVLHPADWSVPFESDVTLRIMTDAARLHESSLVYRVAHVHGVLLHLKEDPLGCAVLAWNPLLGEGPGLVIWNEEREREIMATVEARRTPSPVPSP